LPSLPLSASQLQFSAVALLASLSSLEAVRLFRETFGLTSLAFAGAMITISAAVVTAVPIIFGGCLPPTATKAGCFIAIAAA
jgi:hypothetical protein